MKIAFTTQDSEAVNAHFGSAKQIDIYDIDVTGYTLNQSVQFGGNLKQDGNEDKLQPKLKALKDCTIVYVADIGPSAAARLINMNITPIKSPEPNADIKDILNRLVATLNGSPPPWLRKALKKGEQSKFDEIYLEIEEEVAV
ncbi:nitrogen fixation protein NifX [Synechocystis sp. LKSZ1]|uniref:nitrogen fixation protein NifX n=1 Tax=Synechocystis sp. LKSZ1 TaxID=3144951 RepID=UPI00336BDAEF